MIYVNKVRAQLEQWIKYEPVGVHGPPGCALLTMDTDQTG